MSLSTRLRRKQSRKQKKATPAYRPLLERLEPRVNPSTFNWVGASGGSWDTLANWQVGGVTPTVLPGIGDDANFGTFNGTVTHATSASDTVNSLTGTQATLNLSAGSLSVASTTIASTIANLIQSGGTLGGAGSLTVSGLTTWTGGTMSGSGATNANGGMTLSGGGTEVLSGRTLNNNATANWSGQNNAIFMSSGAVWNNNSGSELNSQTSGQVIENGGGTIAFNNAGLFQVTTGNTSVQVPFNNSGSVSLLAGKLSLSSGGTDTGSFTVPGGSTLGFDGGTTNLNAGTSVSGAGAAEFGSGTTTFASGTTYNIGTGTTVDGGTVNFNSPVSNAGSALVISSGTLNFSGGAPISATTLTQSGGTLTGTDTVTVAGLLTWTGGTMSGSGATNANGGMTLSGGGTEVLSGRTLNNNATANWSGQNNAIFMSSGAVWNNNSGSELNSQTSGQVIENGGGTIAFNNAGLFQVTTGNTSVQVPFNNSGSVSLLAGKLSLSSGGTDTGSFTVPSGSTLGFDGGTTNLNAGASVSGAGTAEFGSGTTSFASGTTYNIGTGTTVDGGTVNFNSPVSNAGSALVISSGTLNFSGGAPISTTTLNQSGGTLTGTDSVTVTGLLTWTGGTMSGSGATDANGGMTLSGGGTEVLSGRTLNNNATANWSGQNNAIFMSSGAVWNNNSGSELNSQTSGQVIENGGGTIAFNNAGLFQVAAGAGTTTVQIPFNDTGSIQVNSGTLNLSSGSVNTNGSNILATQAATTLALTGNLLGTTTVQSNFSPFGTVLLDGAGTASAPQQIEAMSSDLGPVAAGFINNFAYGKLSLGANTNVKLVDTVPNSSGSGPEAVYVDTLVVPLGTTLNLNGLHLYTRADLIKGTVTGGTVSLVSGGGPLAFNVPTPGDLTSSAQQDNWTFTDQAAQSVNVIVATGSGSTPAPLSPAVGLVTVSLVDSNNNVVATTTNAQSGNPAQLSATLPSTGTYHILVQSSGGDTGYYLITLSPEFATQATPTLDVTDSGGTYNGQAWPATATVAGIDGVFASSLEGVTPTLLYYVGATPSGTGSASAPTQADSYTALATFAGSTDYTSATSSATFTIAKATPAVTVTDAGGTYTGSSFPATATVQGIDGVVRSSLEGVTPSLTYYVGSTPSGSGMATPPTNPGTYTVVATFAGSTDYTSASNSASFSITASNLPELQVINLALNPSSPVSGGPLTITWNDQNSGGDLTQSFNDHVMVLNANTGQTLVDTNVFYNATLPGATIPAGQSSARRSYSLTLPDGDAGTGTLQVTVTTDYNNLFLPPPSGHAVTVSTVSSLANYPDLEVTNLQVPAAPRSGSAVTVTWFDANTGRGNVTTAFYDHIQVQLVNGTSSQTLFNSDVLYDATQTGNAIPAGGNSVQRQFPFNLADGDAGTGTLQVTVSTDVHNNLYEYNYGTIPGGHAVALAEPGKTATAGTTATLANYAFLQVANLTCSPTTTLTSSPVTVTWNDVDNGRAGVTQSFTDQVTVVNQTTMQTLLNANVPFNVTQAGPIAVGGSSGQRSFTFNVPDGSAGVGSLLVTVTANSTNSIYAYDYALVPGGHALALQNNSASGTVTASLATYPFLQVANLTLAPASAAAGLVSGASALLSWDDHNTGPVDTTDNGSRSGAFHDYVVVQQVGPSGNVLATLVTAILPSPVIAAGGSDHQTYSFQLPQGAAGAGNLAISVTTDVFNEVFKRSAAGVVETSNTAILSATSGLAPYPDLQVINLAVTSGLQSGSSFVLTWNDSNTGTGATTGAWTTMLSS